MFTKLIITQKKYYTYTLAYPNEMGGHVFYIGKGTGDRMLTHEMEAKHGYRGRKCRIIREILANGYQVQKNIVYETDIEQEALIYEWAGINMIWAGPHLTNTVANAYSRELNKIEKQKRIQFKPKSVSQYTVLTKEQKVITLVDDD